MTRDGPAARARPLARTDADAAFDAMAAAFARALARAPDLVTERWYLMGGVPVRARVVGRALAINVLRAFEHVRIPSAAAPVLEIDLWDEEETGVSCGACVAGGDYEGPGEIGATPDGRFVTHAMAQTMSAFDRTCGRIVGWTGTVRLLTLYELGRPLHSQLLLWHRDRGLQAVHAGLVARDGAGVLFGGPGGAGKSTVALTCHRAGFEFLGDDYIGLEQTGSAWYGHSVYSSTHVDPVHLERFPHLVPHAVAPRLSIEDKAVVMLAEAAPDRLIARAAIRAVALPRVAHQPHTAVRRATPVEAMLRLAPSSLLMLPHAGLHTNDFERLSRFLEAVPAYWLELGRDLDEIPIRVGELIERGAEAAA